MATGKWQVINQMLGSQRMYIVGRVIDPSSPLHDDAELMADLKEEMAALDEKFAKDMEELED